MPATRRRSLRIGCSGWNYKSWQDEFYEGKPARLWLQHYAQYFDTVEVNNTFYRLPLKSSVAAWVAQTPPDFLFAVKASRYLTHIKRLTDLRGGIARYYERLEPLVRSPKLGPVLWQLPASFKRDDDRLAAALEAFPPGRHCFEFRHPSWFVAPVRKLLEERGASLAIGDDKHRQLPEVKPAGEIAYLRLHYGHRGRDGNYSEAELGGWRRRIAAWRSRRPVFVYLNNDWKGYAPANARYLKQGLSPGGEE
jgi:uncharacterized protein YecE (DUF72 family)